MARATTGAVLLVLVCMSGVVSAIDNARFRDRALNSRSKTSVQSKTMQAMAHIARANELSAAQSMAFLDHALASRAGAGFEGYEHGFGSGYGTPSGADAIEFSIIGTGKDGLINLQKVTTASRVLVSPDGVDYSFSEMTAVSGDYWSVKDGNQNIICNKADQSTGTPARPSTSQQQRFSNAFADLWTNPDYGVKGTKTDKGQSMMPFLEEQLRALLNREKVGLETTAPTDVHPGSKFYLNEGGNAVLELAKEAVISKFDVFKKNALRAKADGNIRALAYNDDHFWKCAQETHKFGHQNAMFEAYNAGRKYAAAHAAGVLKSPGKTKALNKAADEKAGSMPPNMGPSTDIEAARQQLIKAYALCGFVSHFLSDQFSAGHLRTPRVELRRDCGVLNAAPSAGLAANVMHDEDNYNCLLVRNSFEHRWWSCGDHRFFDQENAQNRRMLHDAIESSVHEIESSFKAGVYGLANPVTASADWKPAGLKWIGTVEGLTAREALENTCPLYKLTSQNKILVRKAGNFPRPPAAANTAYGSTLRLLMSPTIFPARQDVTQTEAGKAIFKQAVPAVGLDCTYEPLKITDCCIPAGRAMPIFASDKSPFADSPTGKDQSTKWPTDPKRRATYINRCAISQAINNGKQKVVDAVGHIIDAWETVNSAVSSAVNAAVRH